MKTNDQTWQKSRVGFGVEDVKFKDETQGGCAASSKIRGLRRLGGAAAAHPAAKPESRFASNIATRNAWVVFT